MSLTRLQKRSVEEFLTKYGNTYNEEALDYIISNYETDIDKVDRPAVMTEIYSSLDILSQNKNIYYYLFQKLTENHNIDKNILEIGTGRFPTLSKFIYKNQQLKNKGSITLYDPEFSIKFARKGRIIRQPLAQRINIESYDLITAIVPSNQAESIIKQAEKYKKGLFLVLCGITYFEKNRTYDASISKEREDYIKYLIYNRDNDFIVEEEQVPEKYGVNYLILSKKLKK